jgi:hypothetical protein
MPTSRVRSHDDPYSAMRPLRAKAVDSFASSDANLEGWYLDQRLRLLGVIRGHWNYRPEVTAIDFEKAEGQLSHSGIAIVTPIDALVDLLGRQDFARDRRVGN